MAWDTTLTERLRYYIYDIDSSNYTYTDLQLQKFLAIAAIDVVTSLAHYEDTINGPYTITTNVSGSGMISPDPIDNAPAGFSNLIVARAACKISMSNSIRLMNQGAGWKIVDDRSTIDGTQALAASKEVAKNYCGAYEQILKEFKEGNKYAGYAILTPYISTNFQPIPGDGHHRSNEGC